MAGLPVPFWIDRRVAVFGAMGEPEQAFVETLRSLGAQVALDPASVAPGSLEVAYCSLGHQSGVDVDEVSARLLEPFQAWFPLLRSAFVVIWTPDVPRHEIEVEAEQGLVALFDRRALNGVGLRMPPQHGHGGPGMDLEDVQAALLASVEAFDRLTRPAYDLSDAESAAAFSADSGWERVWNEAQTDQRFRDRA